jgi:hypothetical protein
MITYEVTASVDAALAVAYEKYMQGQHIPEVFATGCFAAASFSRAEGNRYRIRYEAPDQASLERYYSEHADRLRGDFQEHFPRGIEVSRETWSVLKSWGGTGEGHGD